MRFAVASVLCFALFLVAAEPLRVPIVRVTDPTPQIDGAGLRFASLPGHQMLDSQAHLAFSDAKSARWHGPQDASAELSFGWDNQCLYLFAQVTDDLHCQPHADARLYLGDHIMLVLDFAEGGSKESGNLWKLGISPGDFGAVPPAFHLWSPLGATCDGVRCAAKRTDHGYQIEASIPWAAFGNEVKPAPGVSFGFDCYVGDSDNGTSQKSMLSLNGKKGMHQPALLPRAVLCAPDGVLPAPPASERSLTPQPLQVASGKEVQFTLPPDAASYPTLAVDAILGFTKYAGGTYALTLKLNGVPLTLERCANRDESVTFGKRTMAAIGAQDNWFVFYNRAFDAKDFPEVYSAGKKLAPPRFLFAVQGLLKKDAPNILAIGYRPIRPMPNPLLVGVSLLSAAMPPLGAPASAELQEHQPAALARPPQYTWKLGADGAVTVTLNGRAFPVTSAFSTTTPGWATLGKPSREWTHAKRTNDRAFAAATRAFRLERTVTPFPFRLRVVDRVTNLTSQPLPLLYRHQTPLAGLSFARVCGTKVTARGAASGPVFREEQPARPTTMLAFPEASLGILAEDDWTRAQGYNEVANTVGGIGNDVLALPPGASMDLEFSLYPLESDDEFVWLNRIRHDWEVNFTIPFGGMTGSIEEILRRPASLLRHDIPGKIDLARDVFVFGGMYHGDNILEKDDKPLLAAQAKLRRLFPDLALLFYFHCYLSQSRYAAENLMDEAMLDANGRQCNYDPRRFTMPIYTPVLGNRFAKRLEQSIEKRLALGFQLYWDEIERSNAKYDYNPKHWDGVTAEIDPKTHRIRRKMSTVALISQPWRAYVLQKFMPRLKQPNGLLGNGAPFTRTMRQFHFPRFIETGSISNLRLGQLFTPISLGDHLTERTELDAYRNMLKALDYGSVYFWYHQKVIASHPTLTHAMYPITPVELGHGYIIGQERILTNKSGYFGWGDDAQFTTRVFGADGREKPGFKVPRVLRGGKAFAEVRLPAGYAAAIIRK